MDVPNNPNNNALGLHFPAQWVPSCCFAARPVGGCSGIRVPRQAPLGNRRKVGAELDIEQFLMLRPMLAP